MTDKKREVVTRFKENQRSIRSAQTMRSREHKADVDWAKAVKERDKRCQRCNSVTNLHAHHKISRRYRATRWDVDNGITLCWVCHPFVHEHRAWAENAGYIIKPSNT